MQTDEKNYHPERLENIFENIQNEISNTLRIARTTLPHPTSKGEVTEDIWMEILRKFLPMRYQVERGFVIDSRGCISDQIDIIIFDRQYTPMVFELKGAKLIPAESVYAVFEVKQEISKLHLEYAQEKIASVVRLHRTSGYIMNSNVSSGGGLPQHKTEPKHILGGLLTLDSTWHNDKSDCDADTGGNGIGKSLREILSSFQNSQNGEDDSSVARIDIGCIASCGYFYYQSNNDVILDYLDKHNPAETGELLKKCRDVTKWSIDWVEEKIETVCYHIFKNDNAIPIFVFLLIERLARMGTAPKIMNEKYIECIRKADKKLNLDHEGK